MAWTEGEAARPPSASSGGYKLRLDPSRRGSVRWDSWPEGSRSRRAWTGVVLVSVHQFDHTGVDLGKSPNGLGPPRRIDDARVVCVVEAIEQCIGDDRALIGVERERVSNLGCGVRCHVSPGTSNSRQPPEAAILSQSSRWRSMAKTARWGLKQSSPRIRAYRDVSMFRGSNTC